jgi:hypothetical protein
LSTTLLKGSGSGQTREKKPVFQELGINVRSYAAAEKADEGMALKILTRAEDMADGKDNLESHAHTKWKRASKINSILQGITSPQEAKRADFWLTPPPHQARCKQA